MKNLRVRWAGILLLFTLGNASCQSGPATGNPVEVGVVSWGRDFDSALRSSKASGKPVFLLFQEVPGCSGCKQFGRDVLSDPEVVRAIEGNFVPLLTHNNKGGRDAEILRRYEEPAWNFQVVRFLDSEGNDLIPRKDQVWEKPELMERMNSALGKAGRPKIAARAATRSVAFSQYCFWTGEMKLGAIDGVVRTEAGFIDGKEVTRVEFDPERITLKELTGKARAAEVANEVFIGLEGYRKAPASDQKRQIQGTRYAGLALTPEQATKVNAFVRTDPEKARAIVAGTGASEVEN